MRNVIAASTPRLRPLQSRIIGSSNMSLAEAPRSVDGCEAEPFVLSVQQACANRASVELQARNLKVLDTAEFPALLPFTRVFQLTFSELPTFRL